MLPQNCSGSVIFRGMKNIKIDLLHSLPHWEVRTLKLLSYLKYLSLHMAAQTSNPNKNERFYCTMQKVWSRTSFLLCIARKTRNSCTDLLKHEQTEMEIQYLKKKNSVCTISISLKVCQFDRPFFFVAWMQVKKWEQMMYLCNGLSKVLKYTFENWFFANLHVMCKHNTGSCLELGYLRVRARHLHSTVHVTICSYVTRVTSVHHKD